MTKTKLGRDVRSKPKAGIDDALALPMSGAIAGGHQGGVISEVAATGVESSLVPDGTQAVCINLKSGKSRKRRMTSTERAALSDAFSKNFSPNGTAKMMARYAAL